MHRLGRGHSRLSPLPRTVDDTAPAATQYQLLFFIRIESQLLAHERNYVGAMFRFDLLSILTNWIAKIVVKCIHPGLVSRYVNQPLRMVLYFTHQKQTIICALPEVIYLSGSSEFVFCPAGIGWQR